MLERTTLARPYAKALLEIAIASKSYEKWAEILKTLCLIVENQQISVLLKDRTIPLQKVADIFLALCQDFLDDKGRAFVTLLVFHRRLEVLPEIIDLYQKMYADKEKIIEVEFRSSIGITETEQESFKRLFEKYLSKTIKMHCIVDNELLGGFVARAGNYVIDGSVRGYLTNLKESIGD